MSIDLETDPTHDNLHTHLSPKDSIAFSTSGGIETIQWRSNHIVDDWTNLQSFQSSDTSGEIDAIDIIIHIFHPEKRKFYDLEKMWSEPILKERINL